MSKLFTLLAIIVLYPGSSYSQENEEGLPLPRFVSTRSDEINVRTGPGIRYPIKWVIVKEDMPLEVIAQYEDWRKVRDIEQSEGWAHKAMLTGKRTVVVKSDKKNIYAEASEKSKTIAVANKGTILQLKKCDPSFCEVEAKSVEGFIKPESLWGVYEGEKFGK